MQRLPAELGWLFWDVPLDAVDSERDVDFVLGRVLELGRLGDVRWAVRFYGLERIHGFLRDAAHPELSDRTREFWRALFDAEDEEWKSPPLAPQQQRALDRLKQVPGVDGFYLAGGTAIALHLGHRQSVDLDFFSIAPGVDLDGLREAIVRTLPDTEVLALSDATLRMKVEETPVDFVRYPYPPLQRLAPARSRLRLQAYSTSR